MFSHGLVAHFFLVLNNIVLPTYARLFIHSTTEECFVFFQVLAGVNKALKTYMCRFVCVCVCMCGCKFSAPWSKWEEA